MTKTTFDNLMIATIAVILVELNLKVASRNPFDHYSLPLSISIINIESYEKKVAPLLRGPVILYLSLTNCTAN